MLVLGVGYSCLDTVCTVENYPEEDSSTHITSVLREGGGAVATALVALSRLGVSTGFMGNTGTDSVSGRIIDFFHREGVSTEFLEQREDCRGLESFIMVNPATGSRTKFPVRDRTVAIEWTKEKREAIGRAKILHLDGTHYENAISAARIAREAGVFVSLDGCSMQADNGKNRALASLSDCLIMNSKYPTRVSGEETIEKALLEMSSWGPEIVMCTLGAKGCLAVIDGRVRPFPAFPVRAVDTTGAGDVFHGAFLAAHLEGASVVEGIRFASAVAALKCLSPGGRAGIPSREEALRFMKEK